MSARARTICAPIPQASGRSAKIAIGSRGSSSAARTKPASRYIRLAIFAGIHGDEPAGVEALVDFLRVLEA